MIRVVKPILSADERPLDSLSSLMCKQKKVVLLAPRVKTSYLSMQE